MFIRNLTSGCDDHADKVSIYLHLLVDTYLSFILLNEL